MICMKLRAVRFLKIRSLETFTNTDIYQFQNRLIRRYDSLLHKTLQKLYFLGSSFQLIRQFLAVPETFIQGNGSGMSLYKKIKLRKDELKQEDVKIDDSRRLDEEKSIN